MSNAATTSKYIKICDTVCRCRHSQIELTEKNTGKKSPQATVHRHFNGILLTIVLIKSVMRMKPTSQWNYTS